MPCCATRRRWTWTWCSRWWRVGDRVVSMVSGRWMAHLHGFGFHFLKVNQEAIVALSGFTLEGGRNAGFRRILRDMEKGGIAFEFLEPPFDVALIDGLRVVSD